MLIVPAIKFFLFCNSPENVTRYLIGNSDFRPKEKKEKPIRFTKVNVINNLEWKKECLNLDVNKKVLLFNETILIFFRNVVPREMVTCHDWNPPWMTSLIRKTINDKNLF